MSLCPAKLNFIYNIYLYLNMNSEIEHNSIGIRNQMYIRMKNIQLRIDKGSKTIQTLQSSNLSLSFIEKQSIKIKDQISIYKNELEIVTKNITLNIFTEEELVKQTEKKHKHKHQLNKQRQNTELITKGNKINWVERYNNPSFRNMDKELQRYYDLRIPNYIQNKLKNLPNNKGYIFRNNWLFGEKEPDSSNIVTMYKDIDTDNMEIHEISDSFITVFSKKKRNNERRKFLYKTPRTKYVKHA